MAATLDIKITADNKQALEGLQQTTNATNQLANSFSKVPNASNQANQALINSGRVLQDLNYGFMGIANNLNPLLESFERLGQKSKEASSSIGKELVSALMGPAGLGVALSAAVFVFLKFGDEISSFITQKIGGLNAALETEIKVFDSASKSYVKAATDINSLNEAHEQYKNGLITKDAFLKQFNNTLGDTIAKTNDLTKAEKFLTENSDAYIKMVFYKAIAQEAASQAAKKQVEKLALEELPPSPTIGERALALVSRGGTSGADIAEKNRKEKIKDLDYDAYILQEINAKYNTIANNIQETFTRIFGPANKGVTDGAKDPLTEATKNYENANNRNVQLFKESIISQKEYFIESEKIWQQYVNKLKDINTTPAIKILKSLTPKEILKDDTYNADLEQKAREQLKGDDGTYFGKPQLAFVNEKTSKSKINATKNEMTDFLKETEDGFKKAHESAYQFASDMSGSITNSLQGAFEAIKNGEGIFDSLSKAVEKFTEDLVFAIIRAQILAAIQGTIAVSSGGTAGAAAGGTGIFDILMSMLGMGQKHAAGGIVSSPQIGMIGEAGPEAIMPLSKLSSMLNTTFNAGAMKGQSTAGNGQFVLKGQDLILAINRSNASLNLRRGF
jgi:hypothetical protein